MCIRSPVVTVMKCMWERPREPSRSDCLNTDRQYAGVTQRMALLYCSAAPTCHQVVRGESGEGGTRMLAEKSMGSHPDPQTAAQHKFGLRPPPPLSMESITEHASMIPPPLFTISSASFLTIFYPVFTPIFPFIPPHLSPISPTSCMTSSGSCI